MKWKRNVHGKTYSLNYE